MSAYHHGAVSMSVRTQKEATNACVPGVTDSAATAEPAKVKHSMK